MKIANVIKNIVYTTVLILVLFLMFFLNLFDPYVEWDPSSKIIDEGRLEDLRFLWGNAIILNVFLSFISKFHKKIFIIIFLILAFLSLIKLVTLLVL